MHIKPFVVTLTGELPTTRSRPIESGEKLRLILAPTEQDARELKSSRLEIFNPLEIRLVNTPLPTYDPSKLVVVDLLIDSKWIQGAYKANVLNDEGEIISSCSFFVSADAMAATNLMRSLTPRWRIKYYLRVRNPTNKPIFNFSAYIALPISVSPYQIVKEIKITPKNLKVSTDVEGNHWVRFELLRINPLEEQEISYSALVENRALIISNNSPPNVGSNPYKADFLKQYLSPEPHIESDHPEIIELASKISTNNQLEFVRRAVNIINQKITYEIQEGEYGAAYAIQTGKGDCTEFVALFVALCRAVGIPARTVAGFSFNRSWERHATAEFLIGGRWVPIDPTGQRGEEVLIGFHPVNIIVTRGNWMGGTLAKEVSYNYRVPEPNQSLDVKVEWQIAFAGEKSTTTIRATANAVDSSVRILEMDQSSKNKPTVRIIDSSNVKITGEKAGRREESKESKKERKNDQPERVIKVPSKKPPASSGKKKSLEMRVSIPDAIKINSLIRPSIELINNSEETLRGCLEIRLQQDEVIKLLSFQGGVIHPKSTERFSPKIKLDLPGMNELRFVFSNRIGRILARVDSKISGY